jgi:hypothetical protein
MLLIIDSLHWTKTNTITDVLYASVALPPDQGMSHLTSAVDDLLQGLVGQSPRILWSLKYHQRNVDQVELGLPDSVLNSVKAAWQQITGETDGFMVFEARAGMEDDD